jgi:hypothetical protein
MSGELCNCETWCEGSPCACLFIHDEREDDGTEGPGQCICDCHGAHSDTELSLPMDTLVNLDVTDRELGHLGEFLDKLTAAQLAVPADSIRATVSMALQGVTLRDALEAAGLIVIEPTNS